MDGTLVVAIYAAVIASGTLWWQIRNSRRARRPHVEVSASVTTVVGTKGSRDRFEFLVVNRSQHPIRWTAVRSYKKERRGGQRWMTLEGPELPLPTTVAPLDGANGFLDVSDVESWGVDVAEPLGLEFGFGTGEVIQLRQTRYRWDDKGIQIYEHASASGQPRRSVLW